MNAFMPYGSDDPRQEIAIQRNSRLLAYLIGAAVFAAGGFDGYFTGATLALIPLLLVAAVALNWLQPRLDDHIGQERSRNHLLLTDAYVMGTLMAATGFCPVPSLMFLLMLNAAVLGRGQLPLWYQSMISLTAGGLIGLLVFGFELKAYQDTPLAVSLVALLGVGCYIAIGAFHAARQSRSLLQAQRKILEQQEQSILVSRKLVKYLPPQVWESIFSGKRDARLQTHRKKLTIFFSDIKGFTETTEEMSPDALTEMINTYFDQMSKIALRYGGTIDKFIGDAMLIFFGDPKTQGAKEDAIACLSMAIDMRNHMKVLRQKWASMGIKKPLHVRMGITTGFCTVGNFGSESRMDYTIIGRDANLASRLQSVAEPDEILIAEETYVLVRDRIMCREKGVVNLKGINRQVKVYQVVDLRKDMGATTNYVEMEADGFAMHLDINKIRNYDKDQIVRLLEQAAQKLKDRMIV